jgi:hypothetical protein
MIGVYFLWKSLNDISIHLQVEGTSSVVSELAKLATQEQMLLDQSKDLLSTVAAIHVRRSSMTSLLNSTVIQFYLAHLVNCLFWKTGQKV